MESVILRPLYHEIDVLSFQLVTLGVRNTDEGGVREKVNVEFMCGVVSAQTLQVAVWLLYFSLRLAAVFALQAGEHEVA